MMTKGMLIIVAMSVLAAPSPIAAGGVEQKDAVIADSQVRSFLTMLKDGKGSEAVQSIMASSPLWAKRPGVSEQLVGQIDAAIKAYGPVVSFEKLSSSTLGTMTVREYYLVQHQDMVTRWEFDLVRTPRGWSIGYFGFTDQPNAWFS